MVCIRIRSLEKRFLADLKRTVERVSAFEQEVPSSAEDLDAWVVDQERGQPRS